MFCEKQKSNFGRGDFCFVFCCGVHDSIKKHGIKECAVEYGKKFYGPVMNKVTENRENQGTESNVLHLRRTGMGTFVKYYDELMGQNPEKCRTAMSGEGYTPNAVNTKVANGIRLFREQLAIDALLCIAKSERVDVAAKQAAINKLKKLGIAI